MRPYILCLLLDVDSCGSNHHNCTALGQYCVNKVDGYECKCKASYYSDGSYCVAGRW